MYLVETCLCSYMYRVDKPAEMCGEAEKDYLTKATAHAGEDNS